MNRSIFSTFSLMAAALCIAFFAGCDDSDIARGPGAPDTPAGPKEAVCSYMVDNIGRLQIVTPGDCNILFDLPDGTVEERLFSPIFGNNPSTEPVETPYFFVVREGSDPGRKILVNFMGGGACWEGTNCLDYRSNMNFDSIQPMIDEPSLLFEVQKGIVTDTNEDNPFRDWTLVYLPYTTGDVHWGSNDQEYTDAKGVKKTVHHRGHDNFLSALRYLKDTYPADTVKEIFVTGQSAGAYGAVYNFPYVREVYPGAKAYCLGDGGMGVSPQSFVDESIDHWGVKETLCDWIPGITKDAFRTRSLGDICRLMAEYYPEARFGQYTAKYDHNQRYFYFLMQNIDSPDLWKDMKSSGYFVPDSVSCEWSSGLAEEIRKASAASNYKVYVAPGEVHTITSSEDMYDVVSGGVLFMDWLKGMLEEGTWENVQCDETDNGCERPATKDSPSGLVCASTTVFPVTGTTLVAKTFSQTEGIAFNSEGRLFVSSDKGVFEVFSDGKTAKISGEIARPIGLAPGPGKDIYVCDFGPTSFSEGSTDVDGRVVRLSPDGTVTDFGTGIPDPNFVTVMADGGLIVSDDFGDMIYRIPPGGGEASVWYKGIEAPNGTAFSPDGNFLYVAQTFPKAGEITAFDSRVWTLPVAGSAKDPGQVELLAVLEANAANDGIAVDENGMVYVAANVIGKIVRIDPADGSATIIAKNLPFVASLAFGQGEFSRTSIYATQLIGGNVWEIPVGVGGAPLHPFGE